VNRESKNCLKKEHSEADAKEVVPIPKSPPAIGPYTSMYSREVEMQSGSQYWQPAQQGYAAAAPVHQGASAGYQEYETKGSKQYRQRIQQQQ